MTFDSLIADFGSVAAGAVALTRDHPTWVPLVAFAVAFSESFVVVSLLVPGWAILISIGALIGAGGLDLWPVWVAAAAGAALGDWASYGIGYRFKDAMTGVWPLSRRPELLLVGQAFFDRWGAGSVFVGRFFGPLRAVMPVTAGTFRMPWVRFQIANVASALVWSFVLLAPAGELLRAALPA